jgi:hypothetical protein
MPRPRIAEPRNPFMLPVKTGRRESASWHRLSRLTKSELIGRLLETQNAYTTVRAAWLELQGRILSSGSKSVQRKHIHSKHG